MSIERFCRKPLVTAQPFQSIAEVARMMRELHVGAVVVTNDKGAPVGMVTDRDIVCRIVAEDEDAKAVSVDRVMSLHPETIRTTDSIDTAIFKMKDRGVRRLPVVKDDGALCGMVTLDDLFVLLSGELGNTAATVRENAGP